MNRAEKGECQGDLADPEFLWESKTYLPKKRPHTHRDVTEGQRESEGLGCRPAPESSPVILNLVGEIQNIPWFKK